MALKLWDVWKSLNDAEDEPVGQSVDSVEEAPEAGLCGKWAHLPEWKQGPHKTRRRREKSCSRRREVTPLNCPTSDWSSERQELRLLWAAAKVGMGGANGTTVWKDTPLGSGRVLKNKPKNTYCTIQMLVLSKSLRCRLILPPESAVSGCYCGLTARRLLVLSQIVCEWMLVYLCDEQATYPQCHFAFTLWQ